MKNKLLLGTILIGLIFIVHSCENNTIQKIRKKVNLKNLFAKLKSKKAVHISDTANFLDNDNYDPSKIDSADIINAISTLYESDSAMIRKVGADKENILTESTDSLLANDSAISKKDSFTNDIKKITSQEIATLKENLSQIKDSTKLAPVNPSARQIACKVWADISKKNQRLYLYVDGTCLDTFKVSTGSKGHETPMIDRRPSGPAFRKYTSKKYPGGNYNGLGNMPYVVFVQGGYGIHGTTLGNIPKLGTKASHGCVRVHPDNAKIFNELVKAVGIENTWVTIRD